MNRERLGSTGIGYKVAISHCRTSFISKTLVTFVQVKKDIDLVLRMDSLFL